jgi:general transcription factor 3C polypeptide 3 (transcription factor C subunit 4)
MQEVIRIEPRASAAWSVLAQCYEDMKESQKALQLRIMAAHLRHDAEEWDRLARESKYFFSAPKYLMLGLKYYLY